MLAPEVVLFTPANLLGNPSHSSYAASEAWAEIERRGIPLVLSTHGTRAQLEPLRRKIGHAHPFITERGGGLFVPDGYFALRLERATRVGRYLCVPFGRSSKEAAEALEEIAAEAGAEVVQYGELNLREISRDTGMSERDAEASRAREFSQRFFIAGGSDSADKSFERIAGEHEWQVYGCEPFREIFSGNDEGKALRYAMRLYREALRARVRAVAIGACFEDLALLSASDQAVILPQNAHHYDEMLVSKLPRAAKIDVPGTGGWNQTVLNVLGRS